MTVRTTHIQSRNDLKANVSAQTTSVVRGGDVHRATAVPVPHPSGKIGSEQLRTLQRVQGNQAVGRLLAGRTIQRSANPGSAAGLGFLGAAGAARPSSFASTVAEASGAGASVLNAREQATALNPVPLLAGLEFGASAKPPELPDIARPTLSLPAQSAAGGSSMVLEATGETDPTQADRYSRAGREALNAMPVPPAPVAPGQQLRAPARPDALPGTTMPAVPGFASPAGRLPESDAEGLATLDLNMTASVARDAGLAFAPAQLADQQQAREATAVQQEAHAGLARIDADARAHHQLAASDADRQVRDLHSGWAHERSATVDNHKAWIQEQAGASGAEVRQTITAANTEARSHVDAAERAQPEGEGRSSGWWDRIKSAGRAVAGTIRDLAAPVINLVGGILAAARRQVTAIFGRLARAINERIDAAVHAIANAARRAWTAMAAAVQRAQAFINRLVTAAAGIARQLWASLKARLAAAWNALVQAARTAFNAARAIAGRIASAYTTLREILKILGSGALQKLFEAIRNPAQLVKPIVDKAAPFVPSVPPKAEQLAEQQGKGGGTAPPASGSPNRIIQRTPAPQKSAGDQAAELLLDGHIHQSTPEIPPAAPGEGFWGGVWRHLKASGNHFLQNWQTTLINLAYSLLTFYPVLLQEGPALWTECKGVIFGGGGVDRFDHVLGVLRHLVSIVAGLVATTGIWALIIGAFTGPGEVFVVGAYETISVGVLATDVALGLVEMGKDWYSATRDGISTNTRETYLSMFSGSAIAAAITIILVVLGAIAARLAKAFKARRAPAADAGERPAPTERGENKVPEVRETPTAGDPNRIVICRSCDIVPGVPQELLAQRQGLSPETRAYLDGEAAKIFKDATHPTPENFDALKKLMDDATKLGGGSLEAGLRQRVLMAELSSANERASKALERRDRLPERSPEWKAADDELRKALSERVKAKNKLDAELRAQGITPEQLYERLRGKTPNAEMERAANAGGNTDPVYGHTVGGKMSPDHIVPVVDIVKMEGFNRLPLDMQIEVVNLQANSMGMDLRVNLAKGTKLWSAPKGSPRFFESCEGLGPVKPEVRVKMQVSEAQARQALRQAIDARLAKLGLL